jgi:hypothetical protein
MRQPERQAMIACKIDMRGMAGMQPVFLVRR